MLVADDSEEAALIEGVDYKRLPFDVGVGAGRNFLADTAETEFVLFADDDFVFTDQTRVFETLDLLRKLKLDVLAGNIVEYGQFRRHFEGSLSLEDGVLRYEHKPREVLAHGVRVFDIVLNFFVARREALRAVRWDDEQKICEHTDFFLRAKDKLRVGHTFDFLAWHHPVGNLTYQAYRARLHYYDRFLAKHQIREVVPKNFTWLEPMWYGR